MKKLMIAAAIVCAAAMSQAALVQWGSSTVKFKGTALGNQAVNLYIAGVSGADDLLIDTRATAPGPFGKGNLASGIGDQTPKYNETVAGGAVWNASSGDLGRAYYMVIESPDATTGDKYVYTSSTGTSSGLSDTKLGTVANFTFNDRIIASGTDGWVLQSVPEPTSGLLLLLGVAGLALRRRRA